MFDDDRPMELIVRDGKLGWVVGVVPGDLAFGSVKGPRVKDFDLEEWTGSPSGDTCRDSESPGGQL